MKRIADFWANQAPERIWVNGFGDWLAPNAGTWESFHNDKEVVNTVLFAHWTRIVGETAALLGHTADAERYAQTAREVGDALQQKLYNAAKATYGDGSQTTSILPLALNLVPPEQRDRVVGRLLETIRHKDGEKLDTGNFGTRYLLDVLCDEGQENLGLHMLLQPEYPGFGFQLALGATTLWEQWRFKGWMNSHNHHAFAGVTSSFYSRLAGIRPLEPGYRRIEIRPFFPTALSFVEASQETVMGTVKVRWERRDGMVQLRISIPANTTARVALPAAKPDGITESGRPLEKAEGVASAGFQNGRAALDIGSGTYEFAFAATPPAR
jgi:alpha-L-rhamnosidase